MAQNLSLDKEIKLIDSLIQYNKLDIAQEKTEKLYQLLTNSKKSKNQKKFIQTQNFPPIP